MNECFNPCFNGSNTYTLLDIAYFPYHYFVSILVLMDLILIQDGKQTHPKANPPVSILVLMDLILIQKSELTELNLLTCFNPCFNGSNTYTSY